MPIMLVVTIIAVWWTVLTFAVPPVSSARFVMGCIALVLMLVAEFGRLASRADDSWVPCKPRPNFETLATPNTATAKTTERKNSLSVNLSVAC